jgi:hypothetical protein
MTSERQPGWLGLGDTPKYTSDMHYTAKGFMVN